MYSRPLRAALPGVPGRLLGLFLPIRERDVDALRRDGSGAVDVQDGVVRLLPEGEGEAVALNLPDQGLQGVSVLLRVAGVVKFRLRPGQCLPDHAPLQFLEILKA